MAIRLILIKWIWAGSFLWVCIWSKALEWQQPPGIHQGTDPCCLWGIGIVVVFNGLWQLVWHQEESNNHNHVCVTAQPLFGVCLTAAPQCCVRAISGLLIVIQDLWLMWLQVISPPTYSWIWPITMSTSFMLGMNATNVHLLCTSEFQLLFDHASIFFLSCSMNTSAFSINNDKLCQFVWGQ